MPANFCCLVSWAATVLCAGGSVNSSSADHECRVKKPITKNLYRHGATDAGKRSEPWS